MSNLGQAVLTIGGTIVGSFFGAPQLGFVLGSLAGNALFPTQLPGVQGPRLSDLATTTSQMGGPVPRTFGTITVPGTVMWLGPVAEHTHTDTVGGKGAPEQDVTTFSYTQSIGIGLCAGEIGGIARTWENGKLVYDRRGQQAGESADEFNNRISAAATYEETFVFYTGDESQEADPTIEAVEGAGNVPGFRGLSYIVYPDRALTDEQARRHPAFKFEVFESADATEPTPITINIEDQVATAKKLSDYADASTWNDAPHILNINIDNSQFFSDAAGNPPFDIDQIFPGSIVNLALGPMNVTFYGKGGDGGGKDPAFMGTDNSGLPDLPATAGGVAVNFGSTGPITINITRYSIGSPPVVTLQSGGGGGGRGGGMGGGGGGGAGVPGGKGRKGVDPYAGDGSDGGPLVPGGGGSAGFSGGGGDGEGGDGGHVGVDGDPGTGIGYEGGGDAGAAYYYPMGSTRNVGAGVTIVGTPAAYAVEDTGGAITGTVDPSDISLADIVSRVCISAGLETADIDVSDLETRYVHGYALGTVATARGAIEPLRQVGFFDCVEVNGQLTFPTRGKPVAKTLTADDIGAFDGAGEPPPSITTATTDETELPRQIRVHYIAPSRDYEPGEQLSPTRQTSRAINDLDVEVPVAITDTQAAQIAEVLWSDAWAGRWSHTFATDQSLSELVPGDCVELPLDGFTQRMRITSIDESATILRKCQAVRDDGDSYTSHAVASVPAREPQTIKFYAPTDLVLVDVAALRDSDNDAGFYAAARRSPTSGNAWTGCVIFKSIDDGATFSQLATITTETDMATLAQPLPAAGFYTWDTEHDLIVDAPDGVTFESRTDDAVLNGANSCAIGADQRWEILQFANAEQMSGNQWRLSRLLRGRRGTENYVGSNAIGDKLVMLSTGGIARLGMQNSEIGSERVYKAVSIGTSYSSGIDQTFTGRGKALQPFAPVTLAADLVVNDWVLSWVRRGRLGQELPSGSDIALSEVTEAYKVDIYSDGGFGTVLRTIDVTADQTVTYTLAQQATDFGSPTPIAAIYFSVSQISDIVGRGVPAYYPAREFTTDSEAAPIEGSPARSTDLGYLYYLKTWYPGMTGVPPRLAYRLRYSGHVLDIREGTTSSYSAIIYADGSTEQGVHLGLFNVTRAHKDPTETRYAYIAQQFQGLPIFSGPGIIRKLDTQAADAAAFTAAIAYNVGDQGDPTSVVQIGAYVYAGCPFQATIRKYLAADMSLVAVWGYYPFGPFSLSVDAGELYAVNRQRPSECRRINKDTGAVVSSFAGIPYNLDAVAGNGYLWVVQTDGVDGLYKYLLTDGALQAFNVDMSTGPHFDHFGELFNYVQRDGNYISVGRDNVFVVNILDNTVTP